MWTAASGQKFGMSFLGKSSDSPGAPGKDPELLDKLARLFHLAEHPERILCYLSSDHSGAITTIDDIAAYCPLDSQDPLARILLLPGDAVIISQTAHRHKNLSIIPVIGGRDCLIAVGFTEAGDTVALHGSTGNLVGANPILHQLFRKISAPETNLLIGPSIGGMQEQETCWCFEHTQNHAQDDGTRLVHAIKAAYPKLDMSGLISQRIDRDKLALAWGNMIEQMLQSHSVKRVDMSNNHCTLCRQTRWHSSRGQRQHPEQKEISDRGIRNIGWVVPLHFLT